MTSYLPLSSETRSSELVVNGSLSLTPAQPTNEHNVKVCESLTDSVALLRLDVKSKLKVRDFQQGLPGHFRRMNAQIRVLRMIQILPP